MGNNSRKLSALRSGRQRAAFCCLDIAPAPRQGGSQKWPSPLLPGMPHVRESNTQVTFKSHSYSHLWSLKNCLNKKSKWNLIFSFSLFAFCEHQQTYCAQKCFQDCHQHWFGCVKPCYMRVPTDSGLLFPAMTNRRAPLLLLARSQLRQQERLTVSLKRFSKNSAVSRDFLPFI